MASLQDRVFGMSIFGDAVMPPRSAERSTTVLTPSWGTLPLTAKLYPLVPVTAISPGVVPIAAPNIPAGTSYPIDGTVPITNLQRRLVPITQVHHGYAPIAQGPGLEVYNGNGDIRGRPIGYKMFPGIFHRPPYVEGHRYEAPHSFGPPTISGLGQFTQPSPARLFGRPFTQPSYAFPGPSQCPPGAAYALALKKCVVAPTCPPGYQEAWMPVSGGAQKRMCTPISRRGRPIPVSQCPPGYKLEKFNDSYRCTTPPTGWTQPTLSGYGQPPGPDGLGAYYRRRWPPYVRHVAWPSFYGFGALQPRPLPSGATVTYPGPIVSRPVTYAGFGNPDGLMGLQ